MEETAASTIQALAAGAQVLIALAMGWIGWSAYRLSKRVAEEGARSEREFQRLLDKLNWWVGSIDSHAETLVRLRAEEMGKHAVWHDPTVKPTPKRQHGSNACAKKVYIFVPEDERQGSASE